MKRFLFVLVGLALCSGAVVAFCYSIYKLGNIGTCASGGPYVSARPCPAGTAASILLIPGALLVGAIGLGIYSASGISDAWRSSSIGLGLWLWSFIFLGASGSLAYAAFGPASDTTGTGSGTSLAAIILLVVFIPMAVIPLIAAARSGRNARRNNPTSVMTWTGTRQPVGSAAIATGSATGASTGAAVAPTRPTAWPGASTPAAVKGGGDVVARLERLNSLKTAGAITTAEFDRLKAEVLADDA
jgi:hypothetical protein